MSNGQLEELKTLFLKASDLDSGARSQFIESVKARNAELANQLKQLLLHDTPTDHQLSEAVNAMASDLVVDQNHSRIGQSLGPYQLIEKIGQGGMGAVYLAERSDGEFEHQVAIKLIGTHAFSPDMIERFRNERQILARLNHPNIARILDGGTTDTGTTYLVMELIKGETVIQHCDAHLLTVKQRLKLFIQICHAIEFAHRNLVVHRDIKPSNILVTDEGIPKVLDFGIAKLLDSDVQSNADAPATIIAITPDYSSPEQILGQPVTTSCDVYSLGVLLFEMLTGLRPYQRQGKRLSEIENEILHTAPQKPSQVLLKAQQSGNSHQINARTLDGDLDTLVIAALRREPKDRYQSVNTLATDVANYLAGKPIAAKSRSLGYVASKFLQRNRWAVGITTAIMVTAASATVFHIDQIAAERDRVFQEAKKSAAVTKYLQSLFEITGPNETQGEEITAQDVLDRGTRRLDAELADQPEIRARLLTSIGAVYDNLGLGDKAIQTTNKAIDIQRTLKDSPQMLRSLASLAQMHRTRGDFGATRVALNEATRIAEQLDNAVSEEFAWVLFEYGELGLIEGKYNIALDYFERTKDMLAQVSQHDPDFDVSVLASMGQAYHAKGDEVNAEKFMRASVSELERLDHDLPTERATILHNLGTLMHELGRYPEAEQLYLTTLEIERRVLGEEHEALDIVLTNLGRLYRDMGQFDSAQVYLQMAVDLVRDIYGEQHFFTGYNSKNLADLLRDKQEYVAADELYQQVIRTYQQVLEPDNPQMASLRLGYAELLVMTEQYEDAIATAREALRICELNLPENHWLTATIKSTLAEALVGLGTAHESEALLNDAWTALLPSRPEHETTLKVALQLAELYHSMENEERSQYFLGQADSLRKR